MKEEGTASQAYDRVVAEPLRFKRRLRIGRKAFRTLQAKDLLQDTWDTVGVAWTGAAIAKSSVVATTFFAPTGIAAWLGLVTAATPVGWVVAAAVASGGMYYGATRMWARDGRFIDEIPKFISTPLDLLAVDIFRLTGLLALKVAMADGYLDHHERTVIRDHFVDDWGYDERFVDAELTELQGATNEVSLDDLTRRLKEFQSANPDCNGPAMQKELLGFVEELVRANGVLHPQKVAALHLFRIMIGQSQKKSGSVVSGVKDKMQSFLLRLSGNRA